MNNSGADALRERDRASICSLDATLDKSLTGVVPGKREARRPGIHTHRIQLSLRGTPGLPVTDVTRYGSPRSRGRRRRTGDQLPRQNAVLRRVAPRNDDAPVDHAPKRKGPQLALEPLNGQGIAGYLPEPKLWSTFLGVFLGRRAPGELSSCRPARRGR